MQGGNESKRCDLLEHYIVRSPYALRAETATIPPRWAVSPATVFTVHPLLGLISHVLSSPPYSHPILFTQPLGHRILFLPLYLRPMTLLMHTSLGFRMHALKAISFSTVLQSSSDIVCERRLAGWRLVVSHTPSASYPCLSPLFTATSSLWVYTLNSHLTLQYRYKGRR